MRLKHIEIILFTIIIAFSCKNQSKSDYSNKNTAPVIDTSRFVNITEIQGQLHSIADNHTPSVVSIATEKTVTQNFNNFDPFDFFFKSPWNGEDRNQQPKQKEFKQGGLGSGVIYQKKGNIYYVITNNHVIDGVDKIKVIVDQEKSYDGKIIAADPDVDIAVIEVKTKDELQVAKFGDSENLKAGDFVIAIGNPFGLQGTMTFGIISALGRGDISSGRVNLTNFIQTDAAINPGNSGGALLNLDGEVIGINTLIYSQSGGNIGIGFAIPVNIAKKTADQIIDKGKVEHGWLGIYFEELTDETIKILDLKIKNGMHVTKVMEDSPAEKAGIKVGDILLELNGKNLKKSSDLTIAIGNALPGTKVKVKVLRDGKTFDKDITLGDRSSMNTAQTEKNDAETLSNYGIELADISNSLRQKYKISANIKGVVITSIDPRGPAANAELEAGDVIYKINNVTISSLEEMKKELKDKENSTNYFFITRKGKEFIVRM